MVCYGNHKQKQRGGGVMDSIMSKFTYERFPGERHAISMASDTFGEPMRFMGPGSRLDLRLNPDGTPKSDSQPLNHADFESYKHDVAYDSAKKNYLKNPTPENKKTQLNKVWNADTQFINEMNNDNIEPMAPIAGKLISIKKGLEESGLMSTKTFSGFGANKEVQEEKSDPVMRLRQIVQKEYKNNNKKENKDRRIQKGGIAPLLAIALPALGALASEVVKDIYGFLKKKLSGGSIKFNHKNNAEKKTFLIELLKTA